MLGRNDPMNVLTKNVLRTIRNGGRDPGVSAQSKSIQRHAINDRSSRTSSIDARIQRQSASAAARNTEAGLAFHRTNAVRPTAMAMRRNRDNEGAGGTGEV